MSAEEKLKIFNEENKTNIEINTKNISLSNITISENSLKILFSITFPSLQSISLNNLSLSNLNFFSDVIEYPYLENISLNGNKLISLEGLENLNAKNLAQLSVQRNEIESIDELIKVDFPFLKKLDFSFNNPLSS